MKLTVQELIDELMQIKDKSIPVLLFKADGMPTTDISTTIRGSDVMLVVNNDTSDEWYDEEDEDNEFKDDAINT